MPDDAPDRDTSRCLDCEALLMDGPQSYWAVIDGYGQQLLIDLWPDGKVTVATRSASWETWGPPAQAIRK
jgi:hypothetical protein